MGLRKFAGSWAGGRLATSMEHLNARHPWSHNDHFHSWILANLPERRRTALDVGCGRGDLLATLASYFVEVRGTDVDDVMRQHAGAHALAGAVPCTPVEITVRRDAGCPDVVCAAREKPPPVDVVDHVLVFGEPRTRAHDLAVHAAGDQNGARIDAVPAGARKRDRLGDDIRQPRRKRDPVMAGVGQPRDLLSPARPSQPSGGARCDSRLPGPARQGDDGVRLHHNGLPPYDWPPLATNETAR